jgi:hypothetical protein
MKLDYQRSSNQKVYQIVDGEDDDAPYLKLEFFNELNEFLTPQEKLQIAVSALDVALAKLKELKGDKWMEENL